MDKSCCGSRCGLWCADAAFLVVFLLVEYANYLVFMVVPNERIMGPVQRIFYFHVGSAIACYAACCVLLIAGLYYLATKSVKADGMSVASGEVSFLLCTVVLLSGMIWGHSAWNTWFRFEPRLVTFLLLWLILLSVNLLRVFGDPRRVATHVAVLSILAAVNIPLVIYSIKLLPQSAQLHPVVVENRGLKDPSFLYTMFVAMGAMVLFGLYLIWQRTRIEWLQRDLLQMKTES